MGLSVHYTLSLPGDPPLADVEARVYRSASRTLRGAAALLDDSSDEPLRRGVAACRREGLCRCKWVADAWGASDDVAIFVDDEGHAELASVRGERTGFAPYDATAVVSFILRPSPGTETGGLGVARSPMSITVPNAKSAEIEPRTLAIPYARWPWRGRDSIKTQYSGHARFGGIDHFVRSHLTVIAALDAARDEGFELDVVDDGGYFEHRDVEKLLAELARWNHLVARVAGAFSDAFRGRVDGTLASPIAARADFERLEAGPVREERPPRWSPIVEELIDRTRAVRR
jgi:hypothetical protein